MVVLERSRGAGRNVDGGGRWVPDLDASQAAAVAHRGGRALVLGAPGTGKTTVALAAVLARVAEGATPDGCLVLAGGRVAAAAMRDRISASLGATSAEPAARTASSLAYGLLRRRAALEGLPPPRLLSGPEQDVILRELLAGHAAGVAPAPGWPDELTEALATRGFRAELRDLLMRVAERGLTPHDLAALGRAKDRPEWVAAARVAAEYEEVTALARPGGLDPAALLATAADDLEDDPSLLHDALPGLRAVIVDDAQDLTPPGARLVAALTSTGADLLLIGDPDAGTQAFRGGDPRLLSTLANGATTYVLERRWRQPPELARVTARVAERVGVIGAARHRVARPGPSAVPVGSGPGDLGDDFAAAPVEVVLARSAAQEARHVAERLRRAHLIEGIPWSQMAVIVRGAGRTATLRRVLAGARVPVVLPGAHVPLRDEPVVAALLELVGISLELASGAAADHADELSPEAASERVAAVTAQVDAEPAAVDAAVVYDLLASPLGGMDAVGVRRLRRAVRLAESGRARAADNPAGAVVAARPMDEALVQGLLGDGTLDLLGSEGAAVRRLARAVAAGVEAATGEGSRWAAGVTAETVLWAVWKALGLAEPWRRAALEGGPAGARADRDLDAVVALFEAAATYVDRLPGRGPHGFLDHLLGQDVAGDLIADAAPVAEAVTLTTPAGAAGSEWDVVAVCGVQEGVWPDLRLRGSVLGSQHLVDVSSERPAGVREALAAVRYDETRLFHVAVSRARRHLLVTAIAHEEEQPSAFLDLIDGNRTGDREARGATSVVETMSAAGVVARLRRDLATAPDRRRAGAAARRLALLAAEGLPGADPADWWALVPPSDQRPRRGDGVPVRVSPSRVESYGKCPLRWLLTTAGGERPRGSGPDAVGSLVHAIVAEVDNGDPVALRAELDAQWPRLGLPTGWVSTRALVRAREMLDRVARYHASALADGWEVVGREVAVEATVGRAQIRGRVDRLERDAEGRLRVIDLKTGASKPRAADLPRHPQLGAYQVLLADGGLPSAPSDPCAGAALLHVGKAAATTKVDVQVQRPLTADDDPTWARRLLAETADGMAGVSYEATAGDWCRMCSGRTCCPISGDGEVI